jgi:cyclopropane-fatty-acyl-phospholipid synthase
MPVSITVALAFLCPALVFFVVWLWQLRTRNAGMIDPVWAGTLGAVALLVAACGTGAAANRVLVAAGGGVWGMRLAWHLWRRNHGSPEDVRYRQLRDNWGSAAARNMFWFFQLQAVVALGLAVAFLVPAYTAAAAGPLRIAAALALWLLAVAGEALADRQLRRFLAAPASRGQVCREGLWRYSRHPNYFFECLHWLSYAALAIGQPWGWLTLLPPILMAWLLLKVSGIPLLEARLADTRAGYREYMASTSALIPWPPRPQPRASDN